MSAIDENHLHADPGIDGHHPHHGVTVGARRAGPLQRERATTIFQKGAAGRRPRTWLRLTPHGREAFAGHVAALQELAALAH